MAQKVAFPYLDQSRLGHAGVTLEDCPSQHSGECGID